MREKKGYIVYILPGSIRFVETKDLPDANYKDHFISSNFSNAYSFTPDSNLTTVIEKIRVDTLFDENPEMTEHARLLKEVLVFPAEVKFMLRKTTHKQIGYPLRKFKMVYTGKLVDSTMKNFQEIWLKFVEQEQIRDNLTAYNIASGDRSIQINHHHLILFNFNTSAEQLNMKFPHIASL